MHRHFTGDPAPPEAVERIARTIRRAPTAGFAQGVSAVVVTDPGQRARIVAARQEQIPEGYSGNRPWMATAGAFLVICAEEERYHDRYRQPDKLVAGRGKEIEWPVPYWFVDAGAYMMLVLLAAIDEGLAAAFFGFPGQKERLAEILGIPDDVVPIGIVAVGVPAQQPDAERASARFRERRRREEQLIHWERWSDATA